ncbi:hypothetical protein ACFX11_000340 [Malus domestica]
MTRSSQHISANILEFDDDFERTLRRKRKQPEPNPPSSSSEAESEFEEEEEVMAVDNRTIKELLASGLANAAPLCIQYPLAAQGKTNEFELKSSLLHHIPKYNGLSMEDPNKHLKEFEVVCSSMTPINVDGNILMMKAFPFSLVEKAKDWLYELALGTVTSWESMKKVFLEKFFPTLRVILLRKKISDIQQSQGESFPAYYERFKALVASCPQHQMKEELLLQYFYEGLLPIERQMLDASAGGALVDKTPMAAKTLIANQALNAQQYEGLGQRDPPRHQVNEMAEGMKIQGPSVCGVCSMQGHLNEQCPQLIENGGWESANVVGFGSQSQPRNDPYSNTYNPGWRDHPNFKWREPQQPAQQGDFGKHHPRCFKGHMHHHKSHNNLPKLTQISEFMGQFREEGKLPSSTIVNPNGGFKTAKAITLRSGKEVGTDSQLSKPAQTKDEKLQQEEDVQNTPMVRKETTLPCTPTLPKPSNSTKVSPNSNFSSSIPLNALFPSRFMQSKNEEDEKDILETFRKVHVNISLLDAIKQVPRYAKFLKELCTTRKRISNKEVVKFEHAMLDLGASINVMPYSIYASMNLGELKNDGVIIQLADRSNAYPKGVLEDVLVQVNDLVVPADFYVLEMEDSSHSTSLPILLGRPFMKTARTKIDVFKGTLTMEFDRDDYLDSLERDPLETTIVHGVGLNKPKAAIEHTHGKNDDAYAVPPSAEIEEMVATLESLPQHLGKAPNPIPIPVSTNKLLPSVIQAPVLELKPLLDHLKYVYLGDDETLPVIVSSSLTALKEEKLIQVLKEHKMAIGWTLADIKGINPTTCMHRILLEEGAKPTREAQR